MKPTENEILKDAPLHRLWTKAVGAPGYDKEEWKALESLVHDGLYALQGAKVAQEELGKAMDEIGEHRYNPKINFFYLQVAAVMRLLGYRVKELEGHYGLPHLAPPCSPPSEQIAALEKRVTFLEGRGSVDPAKDVVKLQERIQELKLVIHWALGEHGDFPGRKKGDGVYWWRKELRRRAKLGSVL